MYFGEIRSIPQSPSEALIPLLASVISAPPKPSFDSAMTDELLQEGILVMQLALLHVFCQSTNTYHNATLFTTEITQGAIHKPQALKTLTSSDSINAASH